MVTKEAPKYKLRKPSEAQMIFLQEVHQAFLETGWYPSQREVGRRLHWLSSSCSLGYTYRLERMGLVTWSRAAGIRLTRDGLKAYLGWKNKADEKEAEEILDRHYVGEAIKTLFESRETYCREEVIQKLRDFYDV